MVGHCGQADRFIAVKISLSAVIYHRVIIECVDLPNGKGGLYV